MSDKNIPLFQLVMTAQDKNNLLTFLNRVGTNNLEEAQMLVSYAKAIKIAPLIEEAKIDPHKLAVQKAKKTVKKAKKLEKKANKSGAKT